MKITPLARPIPALAIACALIAVLSMSLIGCSNDSSTADNASQNTPEQSQDANAAGNDAEDASEPSEPETYVEVDGERWTTDEWYDMIVANSLAADGYIGKQVEIVAPILNVMADSTAYYRGETDDIVVHESPVGVITFSNWAQVDIPEDASELASSLVRGDVVKVNGTITGFVGPTMEVLLDLGDGEANTGAITIEKLS